MAILKSDVMLELKTVEFGKSRFKTYFGNMGEMIAEEVLLKQGFSIWGLRPFQKYSQHGNFVNLLSCLGFLFPRMHAPNDSAYEESRKLAIKELEDFFGGKLEDLKKYIESIGMTESFGILGAYGISGKTESKHVYTPDFVAKKDKEIYIVEVKTNSGNIYLKPEKVQGLLSARRFGLIPLLINLNVRIEATDFMIRELRTTTNPNRKP